MMNAFQQLQEATQAIRRNDLDAARHHLEQIIVTGESQEQERSVAINAMRTALDGTRSQMAQLMRDVLRERTHQLETTCANLFQRQGVLRELIDELEAMNNLAAELTPLYLRLSKMLRQNGVSQLDDALKAFEQLFSQLAAMEVEVSSLQRQVNELEEQIILLREKAMAWQGRFSVASS